MTRSVFRSLRFRLIASVVMIEIVMLSLLVWSNMGVIQQAYAERLQDTAAGLLQQIADTASAPEEEQARYAPDCWWWLYLYDHHRTPAQFAELIDAIRTTGVNMDFVQARKPALRAVRRRTFVNKLRML